MRILVPSAHQGLDVADMARFESYPLPRAAVAIILHIVLPCTLSIPRTVLSSLLYLGDPAFVFLQIVLLLGKGLVLLGL